MHSSQRITNLDFIRGFAVLGILVINVISFGLPFTALLNHSAYGAENLLDWVVVIISSVFFEYKMMGLFSMLFGVGIIAYMEIGIIAIGWSGEWRQFFNGLIILLALLGHRLHGERVR